MSESNVFIEGESTVRVSEPPYTMTFGGAHHSHDLKIEIVRGKIKRTWTCHDGDGNVVGHCDAVKRIKQGARVMKFQTYTDSKGEYRWRLVARNGKTIADSAESYSSKAKCKKAIERVKEGADSAEVMEVSE